MRRIIECHNVEVRLYTCFLYTFELNPSVHFAFLSVITWVHNKGIYLDVPPYIVHIGREHFLEYDSYV